MRIFVAPEVLAAGELAVHGDEHHYLGRVRRARVGDPVELVDGAGRRAAATITRMGATETVLTVEPPERIPAARPHVRALVPLIKGDRMDYLLEKLVEVGVDDIVLWTAARAVVRLEPDRRDARIAKLGAAVQTAARQCGRAQLPEITWGGDLARTVAALPAGARFVLDPTADAPLDGPALAGADDVTVLSGPEGGLAPAELEGLPGFVHVGLGPRVLRAETAPVVAVALVRALTRS